MVHTDCDEHSYSQAIFNLPWHTGCIAVGEAGKKDADDIRRKRRALSLRQPIRQCQDIASFVIIRERVEVTDLF